MSELLPAPPSAEMTLPINTPAEVLNISPESLEVANAYLQTPNIKDVSDQLGLSSDTVSIILDRKEVRAYINSVFFSTGFNNRFMVRDLMDTIIKRKLQEMDEADIGSNKDIMDILTLSHKISMEMLDKEIQLEKIRAEKAAPKKQTNIQINEAGPGQSKYSSLIERLISGDNIINA